MAGVFSRKNMQQDTDVATRPILGLHVYNGKTKNGLHLKIEEDGRIKEQQKPAHFKSSNKGESQTAIEVWRDQTLTVEQVCQANKEVEGRQTKIEEKGDPTYKELEEEGGDQTTKEEKENKIEKKEEEGGGGGGGFHTDIEEPKYKTDREVIGVQKTKEEHENQTTREKQEHHTNKEEQEHQTTKEIMKPPDGGWGWLVALGGFINAANSHMIGTCFSIIFSRFLLDLKTSSTTVAWIYNLQSSIFNIVGMMAGPLAQEYGWRRVSFIGALFNSLSLIISAFAPSAEFLYFSFGILAGIGSGATVCISMLIVPRFFEEKRGRANSILMSGFCIGQMVCPPFSRYLQVKYGFSGGTLIVGAILLNGCVAACLFHPVEWHMKNVEHLSEPKNAAESPMMQEQEAVWPNRGYSEKSLDGRDDHAKESLIKFGRSGYQRSRSQSSFSSLEEATSEIVSFRTTSMKEKQEKSVGSRSSVYKIITIFNRVARSAITNLKILQSPAAMIIAFGNTLFINGYINFIMMVPFAMQASGHSLDSSAWCISISAVCNLFSRIAANSLADFSWFNMKIFYLIGLASVAICNFLFPLLDDLHWLMVIMGVWGCGVGATMGVYSLMMIEVMGLENMSACFGATCLLIATGYITLGPLIGYFRDISSSYAVSMWVSSSLVALSFILWLFMPAALAYDKRKEKEEEKLSRGKKNP